MMIFLKLLLSSGLIFIAATAFTRNESLCYQSKYIKPIHYDIKLLSHIEGNIFYGECNISISILNTTKNIYLHSDQLCIKNIVLIKNLNKYENDNEAVYKPTYNTEEDTIDIFFMDELSPGNYTLNIKYHGIADEVFRIFNVKEKIVLVAASHFHIIGTRRMSSCRYQQNLLLKAIFNISIGCVRCTVLSNMPLRNTEKHLYNMLWTHFRTTPATSPYLATMIVSNYLIPIDIKTRNIEMRCGYGIYIETVKIGAENIMNISCHDIKIRNITIWCRNESRFHMEYAKNVIKDITLFLNNNWKHSNNISKVDHVAIPNFRDNGTIVFGLVFYKETDIIDDKNLHPISHKIEVAQLIGCKVTQEWFYDKLNNPLVTDYWFKDGLITLLAMYAVDKIYPDDRIINLFVVQNQHYFLNLDGDHMWPSTLKDDSLLKIRQTIRAPFILRMLQHALTEETFWKGIRSYVYNTIGINFWDEIVAGADESYTAVKIINYWHIETYCPIIEITQNYIRNEANVSIQNIDKLIIDCLSVTFTTQTSLDFNKFTHHMVCKPKDLKLSLPFNKNGWIIFNIQQIGYYRVNYDKENWQRITDYLHSLNYKKIHVLNRAQIIDDAFNLMIAGHLRSYIFWNITSYLHQEEDYIAWYPLFKALEYICSAFPVLEEKTEYFTLIVKYALQEVLKKIKYEEIDDTDKLRICLRQEAARWACLLDDITCKKEANNKLEQHLQDFEKHKVLPWWKEWTYCKGLMIATNKTWQSMYAIGFRKSDTKFVEYLACNKDTNITFKYLRYQYISKKESQYFFNSFLYIITKHSKNPTILKDILNDFVNIKPKHVNITTALIIIINNVYSVNLLTKEINEHVKWLKAYAKTFLIK
ncbi:aminopeptidase N-like isoform X2 [Nylanderia fulva]|uniref:aminopeptidase N-like isoform X2 n=1 Tax=Nylanderia fulva TaxID=613905 RepID=UPI0010FB4FD1|nr:aminopeptidase N-like isoform X2 [Nylanderia fulva]